MKDGRFFCRCRWGALLLTPALAHDNHGQTAERTVSPWAEAEVERAKALGLLRGDLS